MNLKEILVNGLMSTSIFEMAFTRKVAIDQARNLQLEIAKHLVKLVMYHQSSYVDHWAAELNAWMHKIQDRRLKGTNKPLDYQTLLNLLHDEPLGTIHDVQKKMNRVFNEYPKLNIDQPDAQQVSKTLIPVLQQVCSDISTDSFVDVKKYFNF
jgi:hypothetical protein